MVSPYAAGPAKVKVGDPLLRVIARRQNLTRPTVFDFGDA